MLEKDFYKKVENPTYLKHVLYGDSVHKDSKITINDKIYTCNEFWNLFSKYETIDDKEYIHFPPNLFKILSVNNTTLKIEYKDVKYIMRHKIKTKLININNEITLTQNHSLINFIDDKLEKINAVDAKHIIKSIDGQYVKKFNITSKLLIDYDDYVYDFEVDENHNFLANNILCHNTDSIFYVIPTKDVDKKSPKELWDIAEKKSKDINDLIINYNKKYLLPRCNINPEENHTFFKTELLMSAFMSLDVKKNYAYKLLVKEGNILDIPEISYTGIQVVRSDTAKFTQKLLREMIEDVVLNELIVNKQDKINEFKNLIEKYNIKLKEDVENYNFEDIGLPGKWSRDNQIIEGMKLYNHIVKSEVFSYGSAGRLLYIKYGNKSNINSIVLPYDYDKEFIKEKFELYKINIDIKKMWDTLISSGCERVIDLVKNI